MRTRYISNSHVDAFLLEAMPHIVALGLPEPDFDNSKKVYREYGCGYWGCALPTEEKKVVLKVTSDYTEAIVGHVLKRQNMKQPNGLGLQPDGIAKQYASYMFMSELWPAPIYMIWRESLEVLSLDVEGGKTGAKESRIRRYRDYSAGREYLSNVRRQCVNMIRTKQPLKIAKAISDKMFRNVTTNLAMEQCVGEFFEAYSMTAKLGPPWGMIGRACVDMMTRGLLVTDIHDGNVGLRNKSSRYLVLLDLGQVVPISEYAISKCQVPMLDRPDKKRCVLGIAEKPFDFDTSW